MAKLTYIGSDGTRYEVQAENPEEAADNWGSGELIHTSDEAIDTEILTVKES